MSKKLVDKVKQDGICKLVQKEGSKRADKSREGKQKSSERKEGKMSDRRQKTERKKPGGGGTQIWYCSHARPKNAWKGGGFSNEVCHVH